jgi:hypothetical protein
MIILVPKQWRQVERIMNGPVLIVSMPVPPQ